MSSSDRKEYETATILDQDFLDRSHDNLSNQLEMIAEISLPSSSPFDNDTIYISDRNKYVGEHFYDARVKFPVIKRTVGELLSPSVEFSSVRLEVGNADGKFNVILPGGDFYDSMVNRQVVIKMGLRDVESTYQIIFDGFITDIGGFGRTISSFFIVARDRFDETRGKFPNTTMTSTEFPNISDGINGRIVPYIYGDFTADPLNAESGASVPVFPVNGALASVLAGNTNVEIIISENTNVSFQTTKVVLKRGSVFYTFSILDITAVSVNNNDFEIKQSGTGGVTIVDGATYTYAEGDTFFVKVEGKGLGIGNVYGGNAVEIARDILLTFGGLSVGDFDASWDTFRDKTSPAVSAVKNILARAWFQDQEEALTVALSLLEQVRLEAFIDRSQKFSISPLHFDEFDDTPAFTVRNWDIQRNTMQPKQDIRNNFNRVKGFFNNLPDLGENQLETNFFKNQASIDQIGKAVQKGVVFPNLYIASDVSNQTSEILRLVSGFKEDISCTQTWRSLLLDIGDFVEMNVQIGATVFDAVPCLIRSIGYSADGLKIIIKYWSFEVVPFGTWPGRGSGIVSGSTATIEEET